MDSLEANKALVLRYVDAFNCYDAETLRGLFAPDAVIQGVLGLATMDKALAIWKELHDAFAVQLTAEEIIAAGERVAVRYTERGTFRGPFRGHAPTGKSYELVAIEWFEMKGGRIQRRWGARDSASQCRQIGLPLS